MSIIKTTEQGITLDVPRDLACELICIAPDTLRAAGVDLSTRPWSVSWHGVPILRDLLADETSRYGMLTLAHLREAGTYDGDDAHVRRIVAQAKTLARELREVEIPSAVQVDAPEVSGGDDPDWTPSEHTAGGATLYLPEYVLDVYPLGPERGWFWRVDTRGSEIPEVVDCDAAPTLDAAKTAALNAVQVQRSRRDAETVDTLTTPGVGHLHGITAGSETYIGPGSCSHCGSAYASGSGDCADCTDDPDAAFGWIDADDLVYGCALVRQGRRDRLVSTFGDLAPWVETYARQTAPTGVEIANGVTAVRRMIARPSCGSTVARAMLATDA